MGALEAHVLVAVGARVEVDVEVELRVVLRVEVRVDVPGLAALASTTAGLTNWGAAFLTTTRHSRKHRV